MLGDAPVRSVGAWRCWPCRARTLLALRGFYVRPGGMAAGPPYFGIPGSARTVFTSLVAAMSACVVRLFCCLDNVAGLREPGGRV
jgi:hypothetical protein